jgi:hypothetical protein
MTADPKAYLSTGWKETAFKVRGSAAIELSDIG